MFNILKKMIVSNRLGHILVVAHLVASLTLFVEKPPVNRQVANAPTDERSVSSSTLLAGRSFHWSHESIFLKALAVLDAPGLFVGVLVSTFLIWSIKLFSSFGAYDQSWLIALTIFVTTSAQWLVVGYVLRPLWSKQDIRGSGLDS